MGLVFWYNSHVVMRALDLLDSCIYNIKYFDLLPNVHPSTYYLLTT